MGWEYPTADDSGGGGDSPRITQNHFSFSVQPDPETGLVFAIPLDTVNAPNMIDIITAPMPEIAWALAAQCSIQPPMESTIVVRMCDIFAGGTDATLVLYDVKGTAIIESIGGTFDADGYLEIVFTAAATPGNFYLVSVEPDPNLRIFHPTGDVLFVETVASASGFPF